MKTFHQIILILFVLASLYIVKDDIKLFIDKNLKEDSTIATILGNTNSLVKNELAEKIPSAKSLIETPGALKVSDVVIDNNQILSRENIIKFTNESRRVNDALVALKENSKLNASAEVKLKDMFTNQYFEHVSPNKKSVSDLIQNQSYDYITIGENLALGGFKDDKALVDAWMASPGHRANILNNKYTEIGVAVGKGIFQGQNVWIAVQHFGLPRDACPSIDEKIHDLIKIDEKNIKDMGANLALRKDRIDSGAVYQGFTTNEQIKDYNQLVENYNKLILNIREKIKQYNAEVKSFNECLSNLTSY